MRIALFGGTFDPIHRGHLALATAGADAFALDRVLFAPTGRQPLKQEVPGASFDDRLAMVELALAEMATPEAHKFRASAVDPPHSDGSPNYTVDVLEGLQREYPGADLFVLTGADTFLDLRRWRDPVRLLRLAEWIVVSRPGWSLEEKQLARLDLTPVERARVHLLTTLEEDVSSTELRRRLRAGDNCPELLPAPVAAYIQSHHLYRG